MKKIQSSAREHFQKIFNDHEKIKLQLETQKRELEFRGQELEKRETLSENERKRLSEEIEKVSTFCLILCVFLLKFDYFWQPGIKAEVRTLMGDTFLPHSLASINGDGPIIS